MRPDTTGHRLLAHAAYLHHSLMTTKAVASHLTWRILSFNKDTADDRINQYDGHSQAVINVGNSFTEMKNTEDPATYERAQYWPLVDFPAVGFHPSYLDRSPERWANPLVWVLAPDIADCSTHQSNARAFSLSENLSLADTLRKLSNRRWRGDINSDGAGPHYHSASIVNVTRLLAETEARLLTRLEAKEIRGEDE